MLVACKINQCLQEIIPYGENSTMCLKKVSTFKLSVTLSNLNRVSKFLHCWKAYEICYKPIRHYPSYLRHVALAALP